MCRPSSGSEGPPRPPAPAGNQRRRWGRAEQRWLPPGPPAPLRGPVKAGLRAEARGLAGLQEGGGGAGLPPATAHALPPAQLPGEREREGDMKKTQADEEGQHWKENIDGESGWTTLKICWTSNADSILT